MVSPAGPCVVCWGGAHAKCKTHSNKCVHTVPPICNHRQMQQCAGEGRNEEDCRHVNMGLNNAAFKMEKDIFEGRPFVG